MISNRSHTPAIEKQCLINQSFSAHYPKSMIPVLLFGLLALSLAACGGSDDATKNAARQPLNYASDSNWLCRPDMYSDECRGADLTATELLPDGASRIVKHVVATEPKYDCFYVYPTVALSGPVGTVNEATLSNHAPMLDALLSQAARFTGQCRVFAPLYRQVTLPTYNDPSIDAYLEESYVDVAAAFDYFLKTIGNRPFVVISHSQGSHLIRRLLQRRIDPDPALRARLIVGLLIGGDYLEIRVRPKPSDRRVNPIPFAHRAFSPEQSALHVLDYDFPLDDLMRLVAAKAAAKGL